MDHMAESECSLRGGSMLEQAILISVQAHAGQMDKADMPYILHPLRVMMKMGSVTEMIVAVLHDVIEDTDWTIENLRAEGFPDEILAALDLLTKREGEAYDEFIQRAKQTDLSRKVKLADLDDNMNMKRIAKLEQKDIERFEKYHRSWQELKY